eukprot:GHVS01024491.1.p1 GENE.GHVS01024491.1~~GHVS01024491.1.p1  ORF type:complete len:780 (+),score=105.95 GHVS01024491.1:381-2720(+)
MPCRAAANGWSGVAQFLDKDTSATASATFLMSKQRFSDLFAIIFSEEIRIKNKIVEEVKLPYIHFYLSSVEEKYDHGRYLTVNTDFQLPDRIIYPSAVFRATRSSKTPTAVTANIPVNQIIRHVSNPDTRTVNEILRSCDSATPDEMDICLRYMKSVNEGLYRPRLQLLEAMGELISGIGGVAKDAMRAHFNTWSFLWLSTKDVQKLREKVVSMNAYLQRSPPVGLQQCMEYKTHLQAVKTFDSWKHFTALSNGVKALWEVKVNDAVLDIGIALADLDAVRCQLQLTGHNRVTADELRGYHTTNRKRLEEETYLTISKGMNVIVTSEPVDDELWSVVTKRLPQSTKQAMEWEDQVKWAKNEKLLADEMAKSLAEDVADRSAKIIGALDLLKRIATAKVFTKSSSKKKTMKWFVSDWPLMQSKNEAQLTLRDELFNAVLTEHRNVDVNMEHAEYIDEECRAILSDIHTAGELQTMEWSSVLSVKPAVITYLPKSNNNNEQLRLPQSISTVKMKSKRELARQFHQAVIRGGAKEAGVGLDGLDEKLTTNIPNELDLQVILGLIVKASAQSRDTKLRLLDGAQIVIDALGMVGKQTVHVTVDGLGKEIIRNLWLSGNSDFVTAATATMTSILGNGKITTGMLKDVFAAAGDNGRTIGQPVMRELFVHSAVERSWHELVTAAEDGDELKQISCYFGNNDEDGCVRNGICKKIIESELNPTTKKSTDGKDLKKLVERLKDQAKKLIQSSLFDILSEKATLARGPGESIAALFGRVASRKSKDKH